MSARAARRLLVVSLLLSLLVHFTVLFFVPQRPRDEATASVVHVQPPQPVTISMSPPPMPQATALSTPKPRYAVAPSLRHTALHPTHPSLHQPRINANVSHTAVAAPTVPSPSPRPCDALVTIVASPEPPEIAPDVRAQMTNGTARVLVKLDANGAVVGTRVTTSSGNASLDEVASAMARSASYLPARAACKAVAGEYTFSARFIAW